MSDPYSGYVTSLLRSLRTEIMAGYGIATFEFKEDDSTVTEIDRLVESRLVDTLVKEYPEIGFFGEEFGKKGNESTYWLIDPIDGTEFYIRGLPNVTCMVSLVVDGEVTYSFIYDPVTDNMYTARKGHGAFLNDKKIAIINRPFERSIIATSSSRENGLLGEEIRSHGALLASRFYGAGIKAAHIACGRVDAVLNLDARGGPWDYGATALLAVEAGAVFTSYDGKGMLDSRSFTFATPEIAERIDREVKDYRGQHA